MNWLTGWIVSCAMRTDFRQQTLLNEFTGWQPPPSYRRCAFIIVSFLLLVWRLFRIDMYKSMSRSECLFAFLKNRVYSLADLTEGWSLSTSPDLVNYLFVVSDVRPHSVKCFTFTWMYANSVDVSDGQIWKYDSTLRGHNLGRSHDAKELLVVPYIYRSLVVCYRQHFLGSPNEILHVIEGGMTKTAVPSASDSQRTEPSFDSRARPWAFSRCCSNPLKSRHGNLKIECDE